MLGKLRCESFCDIDIPWKQRPWTLHAKPSLSQAYHRNLIIYHLGLPGCFQQSIWITICTHNNAGADIVGYISENAKKRFKTCISLLFGYGSILQNNYHYLFTNIFIHSSTQMTTKPRHATIQCDLSFNTLSAVRFYDISSTVLNDVILSKAALNCQ